jgi:hypothetical protein
MLVQIILPLSPPVLVDIAYQENRSEVLIPCSYSPDEISPSDNEVWPAISRRIDIDSDMYPTSCVPDSLQLFHIFVVIHSPPLILFVALIFRAVLVLAID